MRMSWGVCRRAAVALSTLVVLLSACSGSDSSKPRVSPLADDAITVGSFDFAESVVVAEVYSQGLEAAGYKVNRAFSLGPREFVGPALESGLVEFVPEYAGTAAEFYSVGAAEPTDDVALTHEQLVRAVDGDSVVALAASPAQDSNTFVVTESTANRLHIQSLSDLAAVADQLTFGGPPECRTRPLCLVGLDKTYGLKFRQVVTLDAGGPLTRGALRDGLVDVALMFTTDPAIENQGLVELDDDRGLQPAESITPLVRTEIVDRWGPGVVDAIDSVSALLTTDVVRDLNGAVAPAGTNIAAVAAAFWAQAGT
jgi:osmoprotectant transport system substrate-binding protein